MSARNNNLSEAENWSRGVWKRSTITITNNLTICISLTSWLVPFKIFGEFVCSPNFLVI